MWVFPRALSLWTCLDVLVHTLTCERQADGERTRGFKHTTLQFSLWHIFLELSSFLRISLTSSSTKAPRETMRRVPSEETPERTQWTTHYCRFIHILNSLYKMWASLFLLHFHVSFSDEHILLFWRQADRRRASSSVCFRATGRALWLDGSCSNLHPTSVASGWEEQTPITPLWKSGNRCPGDIVRPSEITVQLLKMNVRERRPRGDGSRQVNLFVLMVCGHHRFFPPLPPSGQKKLFSLFKY